MPAASNGPSAIPLPTLAPHTPLARARNGPAGCDTVTVIKSLKVKGSPTGTKVRNIRLVNGMGDHDIDRKVDGIGPMQLESGVVKKA